MPLRLPLRTRTAATVGAGVAGLSRLLGRGSGAVVGGRAILAVDPAALRRLARSRRVALVSGTNGKTTTTSLLCAGLASAGPVATNVTGANLPPGLTAALATSEATNAALEVDEAWLARVAEDTAPEVVALLNLSRDQLDRNNEVRTLAATWRRMCASSRGVVVANADDPLVAWAALAAPRVRWVGAGQPWTADAAGCPSCGGRIAFERDGAGWACTDCRLRRPVLHVRVENDTVVTAEGSTWPLRLALPGRANQADAAIALTTAVELGADPERALDAMRAVDEVVGRYKRAQFNGVEARLLLAKNPAGWLEVLDVLRPPPRPVVVAINARIADGRDPSWLWDVPFEQLAGRLVVATGERSRDLAVRLHYAEVEHRRIDDPVAAIHAAGRAAGDSSIDVVGNYTAFQVIRRRLAE